MIRARLRMDLPGGVWVAELSRRFPDATFRLLTGVPMGERSLELGEVLADDAPTVADALRDHDAVLAYDCLYADDARALTRYETNEQGLFEFLGGTSLPPEFPLTVADGVMEFTVTATRGQFESLGERLDGSGLQYDLLSVVHEDTQAGVLTDRQRECLAVAARAGYFAVPRDCTLADVAATLDVDKSSASETLRRALDRIVDWYLVTDGR